MDNLSKYNGNQPDDRESQLIEWKWSWQDEYLKWLCGYANAEGGTLYIGVNDDGYVVGIEDSRKLLESLPNKINNKLGIVASINICTANGAENVRYKDDIPEDISGKLVNQYARGIVNASMLEGSDKRYKSLSIMESENKIWEAEDGTREYLSISVIKYPFAISCDGKYYKRSG